MSSKLIFASGLGKDRIVIMMDINTNKLDKGILMAFNDPKTYKYYNAISYDSSKKVMLFHRSMTNFAINYIDNCPNSYIP